MRIKDVEIGVTYIACIPQRLPVAMRLGASRTPEAWLEELRLHMLRGKRIWATVTGFGDDPGTVVITQEITAGRVMLRLTAEQATGLGLAEGQDYEITGSVTDEEGRDVTFPAFVVHTIPSRWLRPRGERLTLPPDSERLDRASVCREADGKTPLEVRAAVDAALENLHRLQGDALDDPNVDWWVVSAQIRHHEWRRIAEQMERSGLHRYDPRVDADVVEYPPLIRFRQ